MRLTATVLISFALAGGFGSAQRLPESRPERTSNGALVVPGRLIVQHRLGADEGDIQLAFVAHGALVDRFQSGLRLSILKVDPLRREQIRKELENTGLFNFVEPDYYARVTATPNDPSYSLQWHLPAIQAPGAWNYTAGSAAVTVAMIDSGVDGTHPDLAANLIAGHNFLDGSSNTSDTMGHGTTTAGALGAVGNNGVGVAGVEWTSAIMPLVVVDSTGYASYSNIASAITYAADHGARIVNISIGGSSASSTLQSAVNYAWSKGTVVFASAGNGGVNAPYYPAGCQYVVAVGATDQSNNWASFSNYGSFLDVVAPGVNVYTTAEGGGYAYGSGTSYSSPIAAGVGALMLSQKPSLSASALVNALEQTATDLGAPGWDEYYGYGLVNASSAVSSLSSSQTPPTVTISSPANASTVSGTVSVSGTATVSGGAGLASVAFYLDGALVSTSTSSSYAFPWNTTSSSNASHTVMVQATDTMNNATQTSVTVTVSNTVPPPSVTISSPANGTTVSGIVSVTGSVTASAGLASVAFYLDGSLVSTTTSSSYAFSWNTTSSSNASHTITVKATDTQNNVGQASATVTVSNAVPPPVVSISSPANGTTVSGTVSVTGSASASAGLASVAFYLDGSLVASTTSSSYAFSWNTTSSSNASHTVTVKATDTMNNVAQASVTVTVSNAVTPVAPNLSVSITSPANGTSVVHNVTVTAVASDTVPVTQVAFYLDGVLYHVSTSAPYSFNLNCGKLSVGWHTLTAKAWDSNGTNATSAAVSIYATR